MPLDLACLWLAEAAQSLRPLLADPDPDVRLRAAQQLAKVAGEYARLTAERDDPARILSAALTPRLAQRWAEVPPAGEAGPVVQLLSERHRGKVKRRQRLGAGKTRLYNRALCPQSDI